MSPRPADGADPGPHLTCDVAVHTESSQRPAAIWVNMEEARCIPSVPVHLAGSLVEGWEDKGSGEEKLHGSAYSLDASVISTSADC